MYDARGFNHRPYFSHVPGSAVIDWAVGSDQRLLFAVIESFSENERTSDEFGVEDETRAQWTVWTRTAWQVYEAQANEDTNTATDGTGRSPLRYVIIAEGKNPTGVVPLVPFFGVRHSDFSGWPVCRNVLPYVLQVYNKDSDLDWFERLSAHPIPYTIGPDKPTKLDSGKGFHLTSKPGAGTTAVGYLEPTGAAFASLRESIKDKRSRIFSLALAQAMRDSAQIQSADAQREDRKIFAASLKSVATSFEASEQRCWDIMAIWDGVRNEAIEINYSTDFDDKTIAAEMIRELSALTIAEIIPVRALLQILINGEVLPADFDIDAALIEIDANTAKKFGMFESAAVNVQEMPSIHDETPTRSVQSRTGNGQA